ncbi:MAG: diaminopimelate epimerase [Thermodesulfobacteriota bacterium]|nr:diaminopimelate epimerase [Thermodesulfobacteriota bacterium]
MEIEFVKMHGLGNDFVILDDRTGEIHAISTYFDLAKHLCSRHFGVGADGIILVLDSKTHDIRFRIFNSDGSEASMCGNGMRCFAKYLLEKGIVKKNVIRVETPAGTVIPEIVKNDSKGAGLVRVDMGEPILAPDKIPFISTGSQALNEIVLVNGKEISITAVSMGNPNAVVIVDDVNEIDLAKLGKEIETHERFPEKANVEFIEVLSENELKMRVWERGAGETLACGTGACAALVAAHMIGKTSNKALIHLEGGDLEIEWNKTSNHIFKTGPAEFVFTGTVNWPLESGN